VVVDGTGLEAGTALEAAPATNVSGQSIVLIDVASNQVKDFTIEVTGASITTSTGELTISPVSTVNAANSSGSLEVSTVTSTSVDNVNMVLELRDAEESGLEVVNGNYIVRLVDQAGKVLATDTITGLDNVTEAAAFVLTAAGTYVVDVHVESYPGSGEFVNIQDNVSITVIPNVFDNLVVESTLEDGAILLGDSITITLEAQDAQGNLVNGVSVTYTATGADLVGTGFGTSGATTGAIALTNGTATLTFKVATNNPVGADKFNLSFDTSVDDEDINGIDVIDEVVAGNSTAVISTSTPSSIEASASANLSVVIDLKNASPSAMSGTYAIYLDLGNNITVAAADVTLTNGTGTAQFIITKAGLYQDAKVFVETRDGSAEYVEIDELGDFRIVPNDTLTVAIDSSSLPTAVTQGAVYEMKLTAEDSVGNLVADVTGSALLELLSGLQADGTGLIALSTDSNGEAVFYLVIDTDETFSVGTEDKYELTLTPSQGTAEDVTFEVQPEAVQPE